MMALNRYITTRVDLLISEKKLIERKVKPMDLMNRDRVSDYSY